MYLPDLVSPMYCVVLSMHESRGEEEEASGVLPASGDRIPGGCQQGAVYKGTRRLQTLRPILRKLRSVLMIVDMIAAARYDC